jgi:DNA-directed RNA polymerase subunit M/transcription elongation factor TFIIS
MFAKLRDVEEDSDRSSAGYSTQPNTPRSGSLSGSDALEDNDQPRLVPRRAPPASPPPMKFALAPPKRPRSADDNDAVPQPAPPRQPSAEDAVTSRGTFQERIAVRIAEALRPDRLEPDGAASLASLAENIAAAVAAYGAEAGEKARTLVAHLRDPQNHDLRRRVRAGDVAPSALAAMTDAELTNPYLQRVAAAGLEERLQGRNMKAMLLESGTTTEMYTCPSCGKAKALLLQSEQSKPWFSGGEDTSAVFCTCLECGLGFRPG